MVSCAVALYPATCTSSRVRFNTLERATGNRVKACAAPRNIIPSHLRRIDERADVERDAGDEYADADEVRVLYRCKSSCFGEI